jgi:hypothetical protein
MNAKVDARHAFGDYVQVCIHETVNDIHAERTYGALALCPVGNLEGSWYYLSLTTGKVLRGNKATAIPLDEYTTQILNKRARLPSEAVKLGSWKTQYMMEEDDPAWLEEEPEDDLQEILSALPRLIPRSRGQATENYDGSEAYPDLHTEDELDSRDDEVPGRLDAYLERDQQKLRGELCPPEDEDPWGTADYTTDTDPWPAHRSDDDVFAGEEEIPAVASDEGSSRRVEQAQYSAYQGDGGLLARLATSTIELNDRGSAPPSLNPTTVGAAWLHPVKQGWR